MKDYLKSSPDKTQQQRYEMSQNLPNVEELLCLQLMGYSSSDIYALLPFSPHAFCWDEDSFDLSAWEESKKHITDLSERSIQHLDKTKRILKRQSAAGIATISCFTKDYPECLIDNLAGDHPLLIHLLGNKDLLHQRGNVAIVGARRADQAGRDAAYRLAQKFASEGHTIVSGLALGCDTAAHQGCLDTQGKTIAIVASGLDRTHPKENKALQDEIVRRGGLILSEQPFGVKASPSKLVARCRLQVALSTQIIIAQCPIVSGTMYTAHFSKKYEKNRYCCNWHELYAVEYDEYNELNSGNQFLLEQDVACPIRL